MISLGLNRLKFFVFFIIITAKATQSCDTNWQPLGDYCYYVSIEALQATWHEARVQCQEAGGDLVSILTESEYNFTMNLATYESYLWIGLNSLADRRTMQWSDQSAVGFYKWVPGHPLNDGLSLCASTTSRYVEHFFVSTGWNTIGTLLASPWDADDINTFRLYLTTSNLANCEAACRLESRCYTYTYYSPYYPDPTGVWPGECIGRTNYKNVNVTDQYATSGQRLSIKPEDGSWHTMNCGTKAGYICKRHKDGTGIGTVTPTAPVPGYCPSGYFGSGNKCFKLFRSISNQMVTWSQALADCRSQTGHMSDLASISNIQDEEAITAQLREYEYGAWLGLYELSGKWLWTDNSSPSYTNWADHEPSLAFEASGEFSTWPAGTWKSTARDQLRGYVCQTFKSSSAIISTPPPTPFPCRSGYTAYWYACYRLVESHVTWSEADQLCRNDGAHLVSIHSDPENAAIFTFVHSWLPVWIGLNQVSPEQYEWTDGWPTVYFNWMMGEPRGQDEDCVMMNNTGQWITKSCHSKYGLVCKIPTDSAPTVPVNTDGMCPKNWVSWGSHCYYFPSSPTDNVTSWNDASIKCSQMAGSDYIATLVFIHSHAENKFIFNTMVTRGLVNNELINSAAIGLYETSTGDNFAWADGSTLTLSRWAPGEPRGGGDPTKMCGEMHAHDWPGLWAAFPCTDSRPRYYICKAPKLPPTTAPPTPPNTPGTCPSDSWLQYDKWCYLFAPDASRTWEDSKQACILLGNDNSTLVSLRDYSENWFVWNKLLEHNTVPTYTQSWIGLYRDTTSSPYRWLDGTPVSYVQWASGQPDNGKGNELCVVMHHSDGRWADTPCSTSTTNGFICKVPKGPPPASTTTISTTLPAQGGASTSSSSPTTTTLNSTTEAILLQPDEGLSEGAVTGIVVGCFLFVILLSIGVTYWLLKRRGGALSTQLEKMFSNSARSDGEGQGQGRLLGNGVAGATSFASLGGTTNTSSTNSLLALQSKKDVAAGAAAAPSSASKMSRNYLYHSFRGMVRSINGRLNVNNKQQQLNRRERRNRSPIIHGNSALSSSPTTSSAGSQTSNSQPQQRTQVYQNTRMNNNNSLSSSRTSLMGSQQALIAVTDSSSRLNLHMQQARPALHSTVNVAYRSNPNLTMSYDNLAYRTSQPREQDRVSTRLRMQPPATFSQPGVDRTAAPIGSNSYPTSRPSTLPMAGTRDSRPNGGVQQPGQGQGYPPLQSASRDDGRDRGSRVTRSRLGTIPEIATSSIKQNLHDVQYPRESIQNQPPLYQQKALSSSAMSLDVNVGRQQASRNEQRWHSNSNLHLKAGNEAVQSRHPGHTSNQQNYQQQQQFSPNVLQRHSTENQQSRVATKDDQRSKSSQQYIDQRIPVYQHQQQQKSSSNPQGQFQQSLPLSPHREQSQQQQQRLQLAQDQRSSSQQQANVRSQSNDRRQPLEQQRPQDTKSVNVDRGQSNYVYQQSSSLDRGQPKQQYQLQQPALPSSQHRPSGLPANENRPLALPTNQYRASNQQHQQQDLISNERKLISQQQQQQQPGLPLNEYRPSSQQQQPRIQSYDRDRQQPRSIPSVMQQTPSKVLQPNRNEELSYQQQQPRMSNDRSQHNIYQQPQPSIPSDYRLQQQQPRIANDRAQHNPSQQQQNVPNEYRHQQQKQQQQQQQQQQQWTQNNAAFNVTSTERPEITPRKKRHAEKKIIDNKNYLT